MQSYVTQDMEKHVIYYYNLAIQPLEKVWDSYIINFTQYWALVLLVPQTGENSPKQYSQIHDGNQHSKRSELQNQLWMHSEDQHLGTLSTGKAAMLEQHISIFKIDTVISWLATIEHKFKSKAFQNSDRITVPIHQVKTPVEKYNFRCWKHITRNQLEKAYKTIQKWTNNKT